MIAASVDGRRILLHAPFALKDTIKAAPGARWDPRIKRWTFPASAASAESVARIARDQAERLHGDDGFNQLLSEARAAYLARKARNATNLPDTPGRTSAWQHQRQAHHFAATQPAAMLAMDMGTGKSRTALGLLEDWQAQRVLVICPTSVVSVWPDQFDQHAVRTWQVAALRKGSIATRTAQAQRILATASARTPVCLVVNYEAAWRDPFASWALDQRWDVVILDESHRIKAPGGRQSLFCQQLGHRARRRLYLTGTPLAHSPLDAYAQYRFLDEGIFGTSYARFRARYAVMGGYQAKQVVGWQHQAELTERFARLAYQCKADDVLDLPPELDVRRQAELEPRAAKAYRDLSEHFVAEVEGGVVTASNALAQLLRLQQVTSGYLPVEDADDPDTRRVVQVGTEKRDLLRDVLTDLAPGQPAVVFARFTHDLDAIRDTAAQLGLAYGELSGRDKGGMDGPRMRVGVDVLGVQIQAGGVGIDLTAAHVAIYYSVGFSLTDYLQSRARLRRPGQTADHVLYVHLTAKGTIDEVVYRALAAREDLVKAVLAEAQRAVHA